MNNSKHNTSVKYITFIVGLLMLAAGLYFVKTLENPEGIMKTLPYLGIGLGCGLFGHGLGEIVSDRAIASSPDLKRKMDIDQKDERNLTLSYMSKSKAFDIMTYVLGALMLSFALMQVDLTVILLLVFAYLFIHGVAIYQRIKLDKVM